MSRAGRLGASVLLLLAACLESFELPDSGLGGTGTVGPGDVPPLGLSLEERIFSPEASTADACAIEKGCVLPNYSSYQLVDIAGREVPGAAGHAQARCQELPTGFSPRFNCEFWGLWSGFAETFFPNVLLDPADPAAVDCQWIDVTGVAEGDYVLRVSVDPDNVLDEPRGGNVRDFDVSIPALDAPTRTCPLISDTEVNWTGGSSLYADGLLRECGWSIEPTALDARCVPGESVTLTCPECAAESAPMLRVCEGTQACAALAALASGDATYTLLDDTNGPSPDAGS